MANTTYHSDVHGYAVNIKTHGIRFIDGGDESQRERAFEDAQRDFFRSAQEIAEECGYALVNACGRSGGWLAPMVTEREPEDDDTRERFTQFVEHVDKLMQAVPRNFAHFLAAIIEADKEDADQEAAHDLEREAQRKREEIKTRDVVTRADCMPALRNDEAVIFNEPGRVLDLKSSGGNFDVCYRSHCYMVTEAPHKSYFLLVRHGAGDERQKISREAVRALYRLDSDARYFMLHALHDAKRDADTAATNRTREKYERAFLDGRMKKRKQRGANYYYVRMEPEAVKRAGGDA